MISLNRLATHFAVMSIFFGAIGIPNAPGFLNGNVLASCLALACLLASGRLYVARSLLVIIVIIFVHGLVTIALGLNSISRLVPVFLTTAIFFLVFYNVLRRAEDVSDVVRLYLLYAKIVAGTVIFQSAMYQVGFRPGYDYSAIFNTWVLVQGGPFGIRATGILFEPSQLGLTASLAITISLARLFGFVKDYISVRGAALILAAVILSVSTLAYFLLVITFIVFLTRANWKIVVAGVAVIVVGALVSFEGFEPIVARFTGVYELYVLNEAQGAANASSFSLYAHSQVALETFNQTFGLGGGMGSHAISYERNLGLLTEFHDVLQIGTAGNLSNRLMSELGVIGLCLIGWLAVVLLRSIMGFKSQPLNLLASIAVLVFLARNGTYAYYSLAFLICLLAMADYHKTRVKTVLDETRIKT